jgi:superfamily II DNA/RNA helicase
VVVSPSRELAVQTGEVARAICSRLGLTVSIQVGCGVVVSPSPELAVQTGEVARAICSRLGLTVSVQVG